MSNQPPNQPPNPGDIPPPKPHPDGSYPDQSQPNQGYQQPPYGQQPPHGQPHGQHPNSQQQWPPNQQGYPPHHGQINISEKKLIAGLLGLILGGFGAHKFYLGYQNEAIIMLVCSLVGIFGGACLVVPALLSMVMGIIGLIEGILYITKSDSEFAQTYIYNRKPWF